VLFQVCAVLAEAIEVKVNFLENDGLVATYMGGEKSMKLKVKVEDHAKGYIYAMAPKKYHDKFVPDFPLGTYLDNHTTNLNLSNC
jgi:hypothetical protein